MSSSSATGQSDPRACVVTASSRVSRRPRNLYDEAVARSSDVKSLKKTAAPVLRRSRRRRCGDGNSCTDNNNESDSDSDSDDTSDRHALLFPVTPADIELFSRLQEPSRGGGDAGLRSRAVERAVDGGFALMGGSRVKRQCVRLALHALLGRPDAVSATKLVQLAESIERPYALQSLDVGHVLQSPTSILVQLSLERLLTYAAFCSLGDQQKDALLNLLPDIDRTSPDAVHDLLTFEPIFQTALLAFQERLAAGQFVDRGAARPAKKPPPAWKLDFEAYWGSASGRRPTDPTRCQVCAEPNTTCSCPTSLFSFQRARQHGLLVATKNGEEYLKGSRFLEPGC